MMLLEVNQDLHVLYVELTQELFHNMVVVCGYKQKHEPELWGRQIFLRAPSLCPNPPFCTPPSLIHNQIGCSVGCLSITPAYMWPLSSNMALREY